jgi:hypothetical protein
VHSYTYQGLYSLVSTNSFSDNFDSDQKTWRHIFPVTELHLLLPLHTYILVVQTLFRTISIRTKKNFAPHFPSYWITYITYFFGQFRFGQKKNFAPHFPSYWITYITYFFRTISIRTKKLGATFSQLLIYIYYILFRTISIRTKNLAPHFPSYWIIIRINRFFSCHTFLKSASDQLKR